MQAQTGPSIHDMEPGVKKNTKVQTGPFFEDVKPGVELEMCSFENITFLIKSFEDIFKVTFTNDLIKNTELQDENFSDYANQIKHAISVYEGKEKKKFEYVRTTQSLELQYLDEKQEKHKIGNVIERFQKSVERLLNQRKK